MGQSKFPADAGDQYQNGDPRGCMIVLDASVSPSGTVYQDTALPFSGSTYKPAKQVLPERLRQMRHLYEYGRETPEAKARNFYRQGIFMKDYEDDAPWSDDFVCYFPTYQDLNTRQLRGYFSWRTRVRKGEFHPIAASVAYLYIYELLNGIGTVSPMDSLQKLRAFETGYLDAGMGDSRMKQNLRRWMLDLAVLWQLPPGIAREYADPELLQKEEALLILRDPQDASDEKLFSALCCFGRKNMKDSPALTSDPSRGMHLFAAVWKQASSNYRRRDKDLFTLCFGQRFTRPWYPLANTVYYQKDRPPDTDYILNECRTYRCRNGVWQVEAYEKLLFDKALFQGLLHETDLLLRRYLKTGRYLRENPENAWAIPYISAVIEADRQAVLEASRPKITIDLSGLDRIRMDAQITRESLLTEEEAKEAEELQETVPAAEEDSDRTSFSADVPEDGNSSGPIPDLPLTPIQTDILRTLLRGGSVAQLLRENHLMPSLTADAVNEALFDMIGDTVLSCGEDELSLVEDYTEDLSRMLGEDR